MKVTVADNQDNMNPIKIKKLADKLDKVLDKHSVGEALSALLTVLTWQICTLSDNDKERAKHFVDETLSGLHQSVDQQIDIDTAGIH